MKTQLNNLSPLKRALIAVDEMQQKIKRLESKENEPVAIIGLGGRFPKSNNIDEYWKLLTNNIDGISEVPKERWNIDDFYDEKKSTPGKMISRFGGFIDDFDKFDAEFFGISPREANQMDPQQRILLEVVWEALEDSCITADKISGSKTGVFIGISSSDYSFVQLHNSHGDYKIIDAYQGSGNANSIAANRLSYFYNLQGPSIAIDTACSSSLVSFHLACQSLRTGESDMAIAGGVGLIMSPHASITFSQAQMLAPNGRCRTFDANAEGYVRGEGAGVIILKRFSDAIKDNDNILAIVKGSAVNQDGKTNGLTAPNSLSQAKVINKALKDANVKPSDVGYIETHGTGTILGDPIEVQALGMVMKERDINDKCYLGAVKSNIGHLEAAAGIAGLIKAVLVLKNKIIPSNLNYEKINPHIPISKLPFEIPNENKPWKSNGQKRIAGISSFGFGGTNAHIILEEANEVNDVSEHKSNQNIFCLSANNEDSLNDISKKYINYLESTKDHINDICYSLNKYRTNLNRRIAFTCNKTDEIRKTLHDYVNNIENYSIHESLNNIDDPKIAFMFTGQGSQYNKMALDLYKSQPVFKSYLDKCFEILSSYSDISLRDIIFNNSSDESKIDETEYTQPALFIIEYSLAMLWSSWGINPNYLIGHSIGEYVAACIAGVFSLEDGIRLTVARGSLMQSLPQNGTMAVVFTNYENVLNNISKTNSVSIAGLNGPNNIVISGKTDDVLDCLEIFTEKNIEYKKLNVSHAFHSSLMEPILDEFKSVAEKVKFSSPKIPLISNVTGELFVSEEIPDATYWTKHLREAVNFNSGMQTLEEKKCKIFLEIGPNPVLIGMSKRILSNSDCIWISSLSKNKNSLEELLNGLGTLYVNGYNPNWDNYYKDIKYKKNQLPTYAFKKDRYYVDSNSTNIKEKINIEKEHSDLRFISYTDEITKESKIKIVDNNNNIIYENQKIKLEKINNEKEFIEIGSSKKNEKSEEKVKDDQIVEKKKIELKELKKLSIEEQKNSISFDIKTGIAKVLKFSPSRIDMNKSITHLGLDSIMAIELKNKIETNYEISIPISELIKGPTLNELANIIVEKVNNFVGVEEVLLEKIENDNSEYELSYGQNAMWFQHQMAPESIFNPTYAVKVKTKIDVDKFKLVLNKIVERHPSLRTTYQLKNGKPMQKVNTDFLMPLTIHDYKQKTVEYDLRIKELANEKFNLETGPVFKIHLFEISEDESIILLISHHIAVDFWSQATIVNEIATLYEENEEYEFTPYKYSYIDFLYWQKKMLKSSIGSTHRSFWENQFKNEIPTLDLPTCRARNPIQTFNGNSLVSVIKNKQLLELRKISENNNTTLYTILISVFKILLYKYSHQNNIIVGTPTTGRSLSELKDIVGYFVNPVPILTKLDSLSNFEELIKLIKQNVLDAMEHQDYPFNLIVEKVQPERDASRTPIFQVMFVYQKAHILAEDGLSGIAVGKKNSQMNLGGLPIESYDLEEKKSVFDITLMMAEADDEISIKLVYNSELFEVKFIERFVNNYKKIVEQVIENNRIKISDISLVENIEQKDEFYKENILEYNFVHKEFEKKAKILQDKTAIQLKNNVLSYWELNCNSNKIANYLLSLNLLKESKIGVFIDRSFGMIESILAVMKSGYVYIPIDTIYPIERVKKIIDDADIKNVLTDKNNVDKLSDLNVNKILIDYNNLEHSSIENPNIELDSENLAYSIYTSGSTGNPKGVLLTHKGLANLVKNQIRIFNISEQSKVLQLASLSFDASVSEIFTTLVSGASLHLVSHDVLLSGSALTSEINNNKISVATIPPSLLAVLPFNKLENLKTLVSAGEICSKDVVQKWSNGRKFVNAYGPTESTVCATTFDIDLKMMNDAAPIGDTINGIKSYLVDQDLNIVPIGVIGELLLGGIGLARGYNGLPEMTADKFIPNPFTKNIGERLYKTGDLAKINEEGNIEFLGRIDDQVKYRGFRIELKEIQSVLENHERIKKTEVLLNKKNNNETQLVAYYLSNTDKEISKGELREYLSEYLPEYMIPTFFVHLSILPLTSNGKIDKRKLRKIEIETANNTLFEKPKSSFEKDIIEIWKSVLNVNKISINDNFFDLGGHSLNIIQVQSKVKEKYGKEITIVDFFKYPTVELFAKYLQNGNDSNNSSMEVKKRIDKQKMNLAKQQERMKNRSNK